MPTLAEWAFLFLCDKEGGLAVGSGSTSVFCHFFLSVPWLLSWARQQLCAAMFRGWTTLSRYNPQQKCREMGTRCGPGDTSPVPNSHAAKHCWCWGKVRFVLGFSVTNTWCGKWQDGAVLPNPSFCFSSHLLWAERESAAREGWWFFTPAGLRSMSHQDGYLELQSQAPSQAGCAKYLISAMIISQWASREFMSYIPSAWMLFLPQCLSSIHKDFKSLHCRSWGKHYLTSHLRTTFLLLLGV